jgi:uncharacterized membrane protein YkoI
MNIVTKVIALALTAGAAAGAQGASRGATSPKAVTKPATYKKDLPDSLMRSAKIKESDAARTALAKVPNGAISSVEIEREGGKLIYSYDIKVAGKSGNDEVNVNAVTGEVVGKVEHESAAAEKKEASDEAKEKTTAPTKAKKPPVV